VQVIAELRPDLLVKGGDYDMAVLPETALVQSWGGRALALPFVAGYSTTQLLARIRAS
jgi:bifunctional ADP-heptose synthase (sugar kinase/adenylyltransferase)